MLRNIFENEIKLKFNFLGGHKNIKRLTSKVAYLWQFGYFFSAAAQNSPELNISFINSCIQ
jgi:hypothetical protein